MTSPKSDEFEFIDGEGDPVTLKGRRAGKSKTDKGKSRSILADTRERLAHPYPTSALPHGDYLITTSSGFTILVERKSWADLASSFVDKRLQGQLWGMVEAASADKVVLLVEEGNVPPKARQVVKAALAYVKHRVEPNIYVAYTDSHEETLALLEFWCDEGDEIFKIHRPVMKQTAGQDLLLAFPGIGEGTRDKIVKSGQFRNFLDFVCFPQRVEDILSEKVYARVRTLLREKW
jgi:ERCC4-type nuclease